MEDACVIWVVVMKVKVNYRVSRFVLICAQKKS